MLPAPSPSSLQVLDTVTVTAVDASGLAATASLRVYVAPVNDAPASQKNSRRVRRQKPARESW